VSRALAFKSVPSPKEDFMRATPGATRRLYCAALSIFAASSLLAGCSGPAPLGYYGAVYDELQTPGAPRTQLQIYRRLLEDGYDLFSPPQQQGRVYFVGVYDHRHEPNCMIVEAFTGTILQRYRYRRDGTGVIAINRHTPGPGFAGDPPFADGHHHAPLCPLPPWLQPEVIVAPPPEMAPSPSFAPSYISTLF
jgi:hypothetical protein